MSQKKIVKVYNEKNAFDMVHEKRLDILKNMSKNYLRQVRDSHGSTLLHYANDPDIVKFLIYEAGLKANVPNYSGKTPIFYNKCLMVVKMLIASGQADVNYKNKLDGKCPLHVKRSVQVTKYLIGYGANVSARDHRNKRPIDYKSAQYQVQKILMKAEKDQFNRKLSVVPLFVVPVLVTIFATIF